jgi:hypothetical protein
VVERLLPKQDVTGSSPVTRSKIRAMLPESGLCGADCVKRASDGLKAVTSAVSVNIFGYFDKRQDRLIKDGADPGDQLIRR